MADTFSQSLPETFFKTVKLDLSQSVGAEGGVVDSKSRVLYDPRMFKKESEKIPGINVTYFKRIVVVFCDLKIVVTYFHNLLMSSFFKSSLDTNKLRLSNQFPKSLIVTSRGNIRIKSVL